MTRRTEITRQLFKNNVLSLKKKKPHFKNTTKKHSFCLSCSFFLGELERHWQDLKAHRSLHTQCTKLHDITITINMQHSLSPKTVGDDRCDNILSPFKKNTPPSILYVSFRGCVSQQFNHQQWP